MNRLSRGIFVLLLVAFAAGCDSSEPEVRPDNERVVGTWKVTGMKDGQGDQTANFAQLGTMEVSFRGDQTYTLRFTPADGSNFDPLAGLYLINMADKTVTLQVSFGGTSIPLEMSYAFANDDALKLTMDAQLVVLLNSLLGATFQGDLEITLQRG